MVVRFSRRGTVALDWELRIEDAVYMCMCICIHTQRKWKKKNYYLCVCVYIYTLLTVMIILLENHPADLSPLYAGSESPISPGLSSSACS